MKKINFKVGDVVEVTALDHASVDSKWLSKDEAMTQGHTYLKVVGYVVGQDKKLLVLAMGHTEGDYGLIWQVPKSTIQEIKVLKGKE
jgi:hypothetical protein